MTCPYVVKLIDCANVHRFRIRDSHEYAVGHWAAIDKLVEHGAKVDVAATGITPLSLASQYGSSYHSQALEHVLKLIMQKAVITKQLCFMRMRPLSIYSLKITLPSNLRIAMVKQQYTMQLLTRTDMLVSKL